MVWNIKTIEEQKRLFVQDWYSEEYNMSQLCRLYNISRTTGYQLVERYELEGEDAFVTRSCVPHNQPTKTPPKIEQLILDCKLAHPHWGALTIKSKLERQHAKKTIPAKSTIERILKEHGLVLHKTIRRKAPPYTHPFSSCERANDVWSIDFKGQFRLDKDGMCYPLTVTDNYSRFILGCQALARPTLKNTQRCLERIFKKYGLPRAIRSDNGAPFAGLGIGGLSQLSIWWLKLGIMPERIAPGHPEQNGRHERMHRTLKSYTAAPPARTLIQQQKRFQEFIQEFNTERPHQGIHNAYPNELYRSSRRKYPSQILEVEYPKRYVLRKVRSSGEIKWCGKTYFVSQLLYGEPVAIELIDEHRGILYFSKLKLGLIDKRKNRINRGARL